ncbi:hypothetical protein GCM10010270_32450 [Streptomyces violaceus]|nr:hypothetical protein GCM10010270_32450 [Streptomyces janthinus]
MWLVTTWPTAFGFALLGLVLLALGACLLGVVAGARAGLTRLLIAPREFVEVADGGTVADPRSYGSCCAAAATRWSGSPRASARYWR